MKNKTMRILILICCLLLTGGCMTKGNVISEANDIVNDYNEGNIDYDQTSVKLANLLSETDDNDCEEYIRNLQELTSKLKQSKTDFTAAEQAYSKADYKMQSANMRRLFQEIVIMTNQYQNLLNRRRSL